jgi:hypothetical protein
VVPPSGSAQTSASTGVHRAKTAKLRILSSTTKGSQATIVLRVPAAGRLETSGGDMRSMTLRVSKAERLTVRVSLSRAGVASLHRRRGHLKVSLHASFRATSDARSAASAVLAFT